MDVVEAVKEFELSQLVNRPETPLFRSLTGSSYVSGHFEKVTGLKWHADLEVFVNRDIIYSQGSIARLKQLLLDNYKKNSNYFFELAQLVYRYMEELKKTAVEVGSETRENKLKESFETYSKAALNAWPFLIIMPVSDKVISEEIMALLSKRVEQKEKLEDYFRILCLPEKENEPNKEEKAFLELCILGAKKDASLKKKIDQHVKKFGWIGSRNLWDKDWKKEDVKKRIDYFLSSGLNPEKQLAKLLLTRVDIKKQRTEIEKELKISEKDSLGIMLSVGREYAFLRTYRTDSMHWAGFQAKPLLSAIGKKFGINYTQVTMMSVEEISDSLKNNKLVVPISGLDERYADFGSILFKNKFNILSGKELDQLKEIIKEKFKVERTTEVKGSPAFQGKVTGIARIVLSSFDIEKVKQGEILVAQMTFPNYVPAMERAAAFVTDEGGILCHAAIVSREMQKPCIIGTKTATQVFKDGDLVEVDAGKGIVRKL